MAAEESDPAKSGGGLLQSLRNLAATLVSVVQTRLELLVTEVEEERVRLGRVLALIVVAIFFLSLSVLTLTLFVIILFWDTYRLSVVGGLAAVYLVIGCMAAFAARRRPRPRLFSASVAELIKDRERLTPK